MTPAPESDPIHVLHVDDDPEFAALTATFLERENAEFEVTTTTSAVEGLDHLTDDAAEPGIECVVSDYEMPGMDGLAFLEAVRELSPSLPFVLFTGKGSEEIASEAVSAGVTDYLNKRGGSDRYALLANRIENTVAQYRNERDLQESLDRLQKLYGGLTDAIFVLDADWQFTHLNHRAEELLQRSEADLLGESVWDQFADAVGTTFESEYRTAMNQRTPVVFEEFFAPLETWFEVRAVPIEDGLTVHFRDISEKKARERRIQVQNERLETLVGNAPVGLFAVDDDGVLTSSEGRWLEPLDLDPSDLVGRSVFEVGSASFAADVRRAIDGEAVESTVEHGGRIYKTWLRPMEHAVDGESQAIGAVTDITERRRNERDREQYRAVIETVDEAVYALDEHGEVEFVSEALCDLTGYDAETLREGGVSLIKDAETTAMFEERLGTLLSSDAESTIVEFELETESGERRVCEDRLTVRRRDGEFRGVAGVIRDVTENAEHDVYRRRLYETTTEGGLTADETVDRVLELGREYLDMESGFLTNIENDTQRIVRSRSPHEALQAGNECPLSESYCRKTFELDDPMTIANATVEGWDDDTAYDRFGLEAYVGAALVIDGERYGTVCFADRSPRDRAFTPLETSFVDLLANTVEGRLERHKYETELEHQNEQLERFAEVISHDLRNPLTVAGGYLELARETCTDEYFNHVEDAHNRMNAIIEDVLTLARQGDAIGDTAPVSLAAATENAWGNVVTANATLETGDDLGEVTADEGRLKELFENLFRNAVEHAGEDVTVRVGRSPSGFYVEDDGPGVPADEREAVFESGYTHSDDGTGLGLSIVTAIATAHGWEVAVENGSDDGARFEIRSESDRTAAEELSLVD